MKWLALVLVLSLSGCGTIFGLGGHQEIEILSNPPGARLYVDGTATPVLTPGQIAVDPAEEHRVDARLHAMRGGTQLHRSVRVWLVIVDGLLTLGMGLPFDYYSGALYHFPERIVLNLGEQGAPTPSELEEQFPPASPGLPPGPDPAEPPPKRVNR